MDRVTRLSQFLAGDPHNLPLACDYLDAVLAEGDWQGSTSVVSALRAVHSNDPGFLRRVARLDLLTGDLAAAILAYRRLLAVDVGDLATRHDLTFALLAQGELASAEAVLAEGHVISSARPNWPCSGRESRTSARILPRRWGASRR